MFIKSQIKIIFDQLHEFKDSEGYYFWARDEKGFSDNSLITASMSIFLSLKAFDKFSSIEFDKQVWDKLEAISEASQIKTSIREEPLYKPNFVQIFQFLILTLGK